jgi:hypothetical protein
MEALLMLMIKTGLRVGKLLLGTILVTGLAGPAIAGNVYSWVTEDGTYAFTDDAKRIPAKHRSEARERTMGKLTRYERYTEVSSETDKPYADRIRNRQSELRQMSTTAPMGAVVGAMQSQETGVVYSVPANGGNGTGMGAMFDVPVGGQGSPDAGQTTISDIRVQPANSMATRHITVVARDGQPVTIIKAELNQQPLRARPESDFDQ